MQDCGNSIAKAMELPQSSTEPSVCWSYHSLALSHQYVQSKGRVISVLWYNAFLNMVKFLQNIYDRHPMAHLHWWVMGCLLGVQVLFAFYICFVMVYAILWPYSNESWLDFVNLEYQLKLLIGWCNVSKGMHMAKSHEKFSYPLNLTTQLVCHVPNTIVM